jgi:predicted ATP-grasp superfamily ATP-dependent carboligase
MIEPLLIVGGSVRAAAMSARRAGFAPLAIDRFADTDLQMVCRKLRQYDELRSLPRLAQEMPQADWMYTGPLENAPEVIEQLARDRKLLGNSGTPLQQVRNPWSIAAALQKAGLQTPALSRADEPPAGGNWLMKPLRAAGGFGVERLGPAKTGRFKGSNSKYFQQFIPGYSIGVTFVGAGGSAAFVGATEQLLGSAWGGAREFQYVGSVGPLVLTPQQFQALTKIGECIATSFQVQGLFGVDAIINDDEVWPVEVNPRYTASVELLERALNLSTIGWHVAACRHGELPQLASNNLSDHRIERHGKAIVYASRELVIDAKLERELCAKNRVDADPIIADIPGPGTSIREGEPIVTVFAKGKTIAEVKERLRSEMASLDQLFNARGD